MLALSGPDVPTVGEGRPQGDADIPGYLGSDYEEHHSRSDQTDQADAEGQGGCSVIAPYYQDEMVTLYHGDAMAVMRELDPGIAQTVVTSPPYWALRDYGVPGQYGLEASMEEYVMRMVEVFGEVRRVLRKDGTVWLNIGDSYAGNAAAYGSAKSTLEGAPNARIHRGRGQHKGGSGLKPKDLCMIPARVAIAMQDDGWWVRSDIIWAKSNPMPESVTDRPSRAHEYIYLMAKAARYFYDAQAIRKPASEALVRQVMDGYDGHSTKFFGESGAQDASETKKRIIEGARRRLDKQRGHGRRHAGFNDRWDLMTLEEQRALGANKRTVWTVATAPFPGAHFATFPPKLIEPCILAGTSAYGCCPACGAPWRRITEPKPEYAKNFGGNAGAEHVTIGWKPSCKCGREEVEPCVVLDPFSGAGTTGIVAISHGRHYIGIDLNAEYLDMSILRLQAAQNELRDSRAQLRLVEVA